MVKLTAYRWLLPAADFVNFFLFSQTSSAIIITIVHRRLWS
eukprot:COSAG06_NODE_4419_length_4285_cov_2.981366_1_plen_40_part_10